MRRYRSSFDLRDALTSVEALTPAPSAVESTPRLLESRDAPWIAFGRELSGQANVTTHSVALDETPIVGQSPAWMTLVEVRKNGRGLVVGVSQEGPPSDELRGMLTAHAHALSEASLPQIGMRLVEVLLGESTEARPLEEASEVAASLDAPAASRSWSDRVDGEEQEIERLLGSPELDQAKVTGAAIGRAVKIEDARGRYVVFCKGTFPNRLSLDGVKMVVDAGHGAAYVVAPAVFTELGADVIPLGIKPNGKNINRECGALHPEHMAHEVVRKGAAIGIALRAALIDPCDALGLPLVVIGADDPRAASLMRLRQGQPVTVIIPSTGQR